MRKDEVRTIGQALAYITDCNLATVAHMASKKSRPKGEYDRQIEIAQTAVTWMREMSVDMTATRAEEIGPSPGCVRQWAMQFKPK